MPPKKFDLGEVNCTLKHDVLGTVKKLINSNICRSVYGEIVKFFAPQLGEVQNFRPQIFKLI